MNEPFDSLEAELLALRPYELSPDMRERIAGKLGPVMPQSADVHGAKAAVALRSWLLISTACVVVACLVLGAWRLSRTGGKPSVPGPAPEAPVVKAPSSRPNEGDKPMAVWPSRPERNLSATGPFAWPLDELPPRQGYASIPADLLE